MSDSSLTTSGASLDAVWTLTAGAATRPSTWELALFSSMPSAAGGGTELSAGGYARQSVTFSEDGAGLASSDADVTFTASEAWPAIVGAALFDDSGEMRFVEAMSATVADGQSLIFPAGSITVEYKKYAP